jgi:protein ImuB
MKRYASIWFPYLKTDWFSLRQPELSNIAFVLTIPDHGRKLITAANELALKQSIYPGKVAADAKALLPSLQVFDDKPGLAQNLLKRIAEWCIRFSPSVTVDGNDGIIMDSTGCSHLWGGDELYLKHITDRFKEKGYTVRVAIADTIGAAWATARFAKQNLIIEKGQQSVALLDLPPQALRIEYDTVERLNKLGLKLVKDFLSIQRSALRRRFGEHIILRLDQALGNKEELIIPVHPPLPYEERLPCLEPIATAIGIEIALKNLLDTICNRLRRDGKGIRSATLKCFRIDGKLEQISIGTVRASHNTDHLFRLFELKITEIEPALGIELFILEANKVEDHSPTQQKIWNSNKGLQHESISELLDRIKNKIGANAIHRYLPAEHYWPERSVKQAASLDEQPTTEWKIDRPRPLQLLATPEKIEVMAPVPDYPPMNFRYKGKLHKISKADGPERIEQEWWIEQGQHRDYYYVEDEEANRYWLFRLGHYTDKTYQWFIHGFFV